MLMEKKMEEKEFEITSNLFGGYNKKRTNTYIRELQKMIEDGRTEQEELAGKLAEAENCYKVLWERSKGQEETIKALEETVKAREDTIKTQEDTVKRQEARLNKQEEMIEELMKKSTAIPFEKIEKTIKKQLEKAKKKRKS